MGGRAGGAAGPMISIAMIAMMVAFLVPAMGGARQAARQTVAMTNLRSLAMAAQIYAMDHDGCLPPSRELLLPYGHEELDLFGGPYGEEIFYLVEEISERYGPFDPRSLRLFALDQQTVLFYQPQGQKVLAAFADGNVEAIPEDYFLEIRDSSLRDLMSRYRPEFNAYPDAIPQKAPTELIPEEIPAPAPVYDSP